MEQACPLADLTVWATVGRAPQHGEGRDIFERLYAVRLDRLRELEECRELLTDMDSRAAAAMKGHITRKTVGYLPRRRRLIQRMIRKGSREYLDWMFESDETLAEAFIFAGAEITRLMATSGMTLDEICEQIGLDVDTADMVMATVNAPPLVAMELPRESVLLPISKIVGAADWLHESEIELLAIRPEDHDGAEYRRFDFGSEEDAMLFRLRFL